MLHSTLSKNQGLTFISNNFSVYLEIASYHHQNISYLLPAFFGNTILIKSLFFGCPLCVLLPSFASLGHLLLSPILFLFLFIVSFFFLFLFFIYKKKKTFFITVSLNVIRSIALLLKKRSIQYLFITFIYIYIYIHSYKKFSFSFFLSL